MPTFGVYLDTKTTQFIRDDSSQVVSKFYKFPGAIVSGSLAVNTFKGTSKHPDDITWSTVTTAAFPYTTTGGITTDDTYWIYSWHNIYVGRRPTFLCSIQSQRLQSPDPLYALVMGAASMNVSYTLPNRITYTLYMNSPFDTSAGNVSSNTAMNQVTLNKMQIATRRYKSLFKRTNDYGGSLTDLYLFLDNPASTPYAYTKFYNTTPSSLTSLTSFNKTRPAAVLPAGGTTRGSGSFFPDVACPSPEQCAIADATILGGVCATVLSGGLGGVWAALMVGIPSSLMMLNPQQNRDGMGDSPQDATIFSTEKFEFALSDCCKSIVTAWNPNL